MENNNGKGNEIDGGSDAQPQHMEDNEKYNDLEPVIKVLDVESEPQHQPIEENEKNCKLESTINVSATNDGVFTFKAIPSKDTTVGVGKRIHGSWNR